MSLDSYRHIAMPRQRPTLPGRLVEPESADHSAVAAKNLAESFGEQFLANDLNNLGPNSQQVPRSMRRTVPSENRIAGRGSGQCAGGCIPQLFDFG